MKAVVKQSEKPFDLIVKEIPDAQAGIGEVLIKLNKVGICGSDLHIYAGHSGYDWLSYPLVLGHEMTGVVAQTSDLEDRDLIGKRVVVNPYIPCGTCEYCQKGFENRCDNNRFFSEKKPPQSLQYGFRQHGGMAEYISVPKENAVPVQDDVTDDVAAISEAIAVGLTAVEKVNGVDEKTFVIFGPGPIGLSIASLLIGLKAKRIVMVGIPGDEQRLEKAKDLGVDRVVISTNDITEQLLDNENGFDAVFDCSGHFSVPKTAVNVLKKGGEIILVGISANEFSLAMNQIVRGEIQIKGSYGITRDTFKKTLAYAVNRDFPFHKLVSETFPLHKAREAFDHALNKAAGKIILRIQDEKELF